MYKSLITSTLLLLVVAGSLSAWANKQRIAVLDLRLVNAPPALKAQVKEKLLAGLQSSGYEVVVPDDEHKEACLLGPCLVEVGKSQQAAWVLTVGMTAIGTSYDILLTLQDTTAGRLLAQIKRRCDVCTYNEAAAAVQRASTDVVAAAHTLSDRQGWLVLSSKPAGANARLDGAVLGVTPLRRLAASGTHRLSLSKGALGMSKTIAVVARQENVFHLELQPSPKQHDGTGNSSWLGLVVGGLGFGAGAAGAFVWANDHDVPGAALVGAGISAVVCGTIMYFTSSSHD